MSIEITKILLIMQKLQHHNIWTTPYLDLVRNFTSITLIIALEIYKDKVFDLLRPNDKESNDKMVRVEIFKNSIEDNEDRLEKSYSYQKKTVPFQVFFTPILLNDVNDTTIKNNNFKRKKLICRSIDKTDDIYDIMKEANENRIMKSTLLNDQSSRSHCVETIQNKRKNDRTNEEHVVKVNLVDLAGSERL